MSTGDRDDTDTSRRQFLTAASTVIGGIGLGLAAVPFIGSWLPSAKAQALGAPVDVDLSKVEEGQKITVPWRGQPVFIVHRTKEELSALPSLNNMLRDPLSHEDQQPKYITELYRSIKPEYLVLIGICTHLGCVPLFRPAPGSVEADWKGGFFCPCHGSKYDLAGRVYKDVPAPLNLVVPPYKYLSDSAIRVGESPA
ncbi:MAG TPA: ubiquinol-cytochrome c reductase iron-sulfur subunit [Gammaproteobacteria bacterium]|nr:ubiquinol-cytochrome c reductase iron-sulfur subunit [Gammaproteobacteria bacterium]